MFGVCSSIWLSGVEVFSGCFWMFLVVIWYWLLLMFGDSVLWVWLSWVWMVIVFRFLMEEEVLLVVVVKVGRLVKVRVKVMLVVRGEGFMVREGVVGCGRGWFMMCKCYFVINYVFVLCG